MFYDIDIDKWGRQLLPPVLRRKRLQAFLRVLLLPLQQMKQSFSSYRDSAIGRVNVNGQVIYMEKALNDAFFLTEREISITDAAGDMSRLYPEPEYTFIVHGDGAASYVKGEGDPRYTADFTVNVPSFLSDVQDTVREVIEYNKPAGRSYEIKMYDYE